LDAFKCFLNLAVYDVNLRFLIYKVVQIWPWRFVCKQVTVCPGHIWTTLYILQTLVVYPQNYSEINAIIKKITLLRSEVIIYSGTFRPQETNRTVYKRLTHHRSYIYESVYIHSYNLQWNKYILMYQDTDNIFFTSKRCVRPVSTYK
jgi:hypothetical protein